MRELNTSQGCRAWDQALAKVVKTPPLALGYPRDMVEAIREGDIPGVQLRCRRWLPVPAEEVWRWLTEAEPLGRWLAGKARVKTGPGGGLELAGQAEDGSALREEAKTLAFEPPRLWVLSFRQPAWPAATRLTLELTPGETAPGETPSRWAAGLGPRAVCELSVLQQGFEHLPLSDGLTLWETYRRRWTEALDRLENALP